MVLPRPPVQDLGVEEARENHCDGPRVRIAGGGVRCGRGSMLGRSQTGGRTTAEAGREGQLK